MVLLEAPGLGFELQYELSIAGSAPLPPRIGYAGTVSHYVPFALAAVPGVWLTLCTVIHALAERHRHKTFRVELPGGGIVSADGQSAQDVAQLLNAAEVLFERQLQAHLASEQQQLETTEPYFALVDQAAQRLLEHRRDLGIPEGAFEGYPLRHALDEMADLLTDCRTMRQRSILAHRLGRVVWLLHQLEQRSGNPTSTTDEAQQALAAAAQVVENLPEEVFGPMG